MKLIKVAVAIIISLFCCPDCDGVCKGYLTLKAEIPTIRIAAERNGIKFGSDDWFILLAIRKAENGRDGLQFGIKNPKAYNLDKQAGWASATIIKNRKRWELAGKPDEFIDFMGKRYCPPNAHPLNKHWRKNVKFWFNKFKGQK